MNKIKAALITIAGLIGISCLVGAIAPQTFSVAAPTTVVELTATADPLASPTPHFTHEVVVVLENHSFNQVIGNKSMPYFNSLAREYGLAKEYYANTHPSIGNYFMLTTGRIITNNDNYQGTVATGTIVTALAVANKTWKVYAEGLPSPGYVGGNKARYLKRHNPFVYFKEVLNDPQQKANVVPFSTFTFDREHDQLPNFSLVVPDACHDAHDCSLAVADQWLKQNLDPLVKNKSFQKDGLLVILFDEGSARDRAKGGGHDPLIMVGGNVKRGFQSTKVYQHQNLLKTVLLGLDIQSSLGASATATPMSDFFTNNLANTRDGVQNNNQALTAKQLTASPSTTLAEWKKILTPAQYHILREQGTEAPFSSPLDQETRPGTYVSADCGEPLFRSEQKYDSGTGWPSFWAPINPTAVTLIKDNNIFWEERVEVVATHCGGHLGHIFDDGPAPTGKRYCMNGIALKFIPDAR